MLPDLPVNPILALRKEQRLTQQDLAIRLGVSEQTIRRAEQGTFNSLPASFHCLADNLPQAFEQWRVIKRNALRILVPTNYNYSMQLSKRHPHFLFRCEIMVNARAHKLTKSAVDSVAGYAKLVAIDPETIVDFEASYQLPRTYMANLLGDLGVPRGDFGLFIRQPRND